MKVSVNTAIIKEAIAKACIPPTGLDADQTMVQLATGVSINVKLLVNVTPLDGDVVEFRLRLNDEQWLYLGKHNGKRFYWKKDDTIEIELPEHEELEEKRVVICPDKGRYTPYERGERISLDCADDVALSLRLITSVSMLVNLVVTVLDEFEVVLPKKTNADTWVGHALNKWSHLNNGQQRMLVGQVLRAAIKGNEDILPRVNELVESLHEDIAEREVEKEETKPTKSRPLPIKVKSKRKAK